MPLINRSCLIKYLLDQQGNSLFFSWSIIYLYPKCYEKPNFRLNIECDIYKWVLLANNKFDKFFNASNLSY